MAKKIPAGEDDLYTANEKYNILKGKEPTTPVIFAIDKKVRKFSRKVKMSEIKIIEARKAWDKAEADFIKNKKGPHKTKFKMIMIGMKKAFKALKEKVEKETKVIVTLSQQKQAAEGVKGEFKKKLKVFSFAMKKVKLAKRKEELSFKAWDREANNPKANPEVVEGLKEKVATYKEALKTMKKNLKGVEKDFKKIQVTYWISIGKIKPVKILTPKEKKIAQKKKLAEFLTNKYLDEKEIVDKQKQIYDNAVFENKEAIKLEFKDKIEKTKKVMDKAKEKLNALNAVFAPIKKLKTSYHKYNKAVKEERFKDAAKLKSEVVACKQAISDVQSPIIKSKAKTLDKSKADLVNMKLVLINSQKIEKESKDLERVEKIIGNKKVFEETDKALGLVKAEVNKAVIIESTKTVKRKKRALDKKLKKYAKLGTPALQGKIKKFEARLDEEKKSKDENKKALIKKAMARIKEAQKELKLQVNIDTAITNIARANKNVLDAKGSGKISEITAAEKKLEKARGFLFAANQKRLAQTRDVVKKAKNTYETGKKKGDVNMMKRAKKTIRKFKKKMSRIVVLSKARKRFIMVSKRLDDDKYMSDQDKILVKAKEEIIKAEMTGRERAIKTAKNKRDVIRNRKEKQQKSLNEERIRDSNKELRICKKNVDEAIKTKNFDLINIARKELRHARSSCAKSNIIKISMANKIMDQKEEKRSLYKSRKKELRKDVKSMLKKSNILLLKAKKEGNKKRIDDVKKEVSLHRKELKSIEMSGTKKAVELANKNLIKVRGMYKVVIALNGEGSDEAFKVEEEVKKAEKIMKHETAFLKANIAFKIAEKEVVKEKKAKKRALVKETRDQLKESKSLYKFTKLHGSKYMLKYIRREIRANRKDIGKITKIETAKHNYLKSKRMTSMSYKLASKRLVRIVQGKFRKEKRMYRAAVKAGRRRATKKAIQMLQSIKTAFDKTQTKI